MMVIYRWIPWLLLVMISVTVCRASDIRGGAVDYSKEQNWYGGFPTSNREVDVFFLPPTSSSDKDGAKGNMDINNHAGRSVINYWFAVGNELFGESCNFYAPYHRQVTMESWGKPYFNECYGVALADVLSAFDYYMEHLNKGRPLILAGHSQGAKLVYSLIKARITAENYPKLIAAYPIGYRVEFRDMKESPYIRPAASATDTGVCISYHSAASPERAMFPRSPININPLNWRTDSEDASAELNLGSVFFNSKGEIEREVKALVGARLDSATTALIVQGISPKEYYRPYLGGYFFKEGNYHLLDLNLFFRNLQRNVMDRIESYYGKKYHCD